MIDSVRSIRIYIYRWIDKDIKLRVKAVEQQCWDPELLTQHTYLRKDQRE